MKSKASCRINRFHKFSDPPNRQTCTCHGIRLDLKRYANQQTNQGNETMMPAIHTFGPFEFGRKFAIRVTFSNRNDRIVTITAHSEQQAEDKLDRAIRLMERLRHSYQKTHPAPSAHSPHISYKMF
jgi:hypothetical protein